MCIEIFCSSMWTGDPAVLFGAGTHLLVWCRNSHNKLNKQYKGSPHHRPSVWERILPYPQYLSIGNIIQRKTALFKSSNVKNVQSLCSWFMQLLSALKGQNFLLAFKEKQRTAFAICTKSLINQSTMWTFQPKRVRSPVSQMQQETKDTICALLC